jgi:hypothetical protein
MTDIATSGPAADLRKWKRDLMLHPSTTNLWLDIEAALDLNDELVESLRALVAMYGPSSDYDYKAKAAWLRAERVLAKASGQ